MFFWKRSLQVVTAVGLLVLGTACASSSNLEQTRDQLAALQQKMDTLTQDLAAAQAGLATTTGDLARTRADLAAAQSDLAKLKDGLGTSSADLAKARADLTGATNSLGDLKNTFLSLRQDVEKVQTVQDKAQKAARFMVVGHLYAFMGAASDEDALNAAAVAVTGAVRATDDSALTGAWADFLAPFQRCIATGQGCELAFSNQASFHALLGQRLVEAQK